MQRGKLRKDGVFHFEDPSSFQEELDSLFRSGGILVEASAEVPLRVPATYVVRVRGIEREVSLKAEAVYATQGVSGFQILNLHEVRSDLTRLGEIVQQQLKEPSSPLGPGEEGRAVLSPGALPPVATAAAVAGEDEEVLAPGSNAAAAAILRPEVIGGTGKRVPRMTTALPAAPFVHRGDLVRAFSLEQLIDSSRRHEQLTQGAPLPALQVLLAAGDMRQQRTLEMGGWMLAFSGWRVVACAPPDKDSSLNYLGKKAPPRNVVEALQREAKGACTVEKLAVDRGLVQPNDIARGLYQLLVSRAAELVAVYSGSYLLRGGLPAPAVAAVPFEAVGRDLVRKAIRTLPPGALRTYIAEHERLALSLRPGAEELIRRLTLGESRDERWILRLDGRLSLVEMIRQAPIAHQAAYELIAALVALGLCTFATPRTVGIKPEEILQDWLARIESQPPFATLGLHWSASSGEIRRRIMERRQELIPNGELASWSERAGEMARRVLSLLEAAFAELEDAGRRRKARRTVASKDEIYMARDLFRKQLMVASIRGEDARLREIEEVMSELGGE
jgi:hypothetical protein